MKSVLISIQPKWVEKIANGQKTIEVRKTAPDVPFKCYIYATKAKKWFRSGIILTSNELLWLSSGKIKMCDGFELWADGEDYQCVNGKVIGEFVCDKIDKFVVGSLYSDDIQKEACLSYTELVNYFYDGKPDGTVRVGYGWHISDLKIYDKPKELSEFANALSNRDIRCKHIEKRQTVNGRQYMKCTLQNCICEFRRLGWQTDCIGYEMLKERKPITRPPQSWQYVEEL